MEHTSIIGLFLLAVQLTNDGEEPISGILLVDMKYSIIEETFEKINGNSNSVYYYLCDGNGDIIYHQERLRN